MKVTIQPAENRAILLIPLVFPAGGDQYGVE